MFVPGELFQPSLMFVGKAKSLHTAKLGEGRKAFPPSPSFAAGWGGSTGIGEPPGACRLNGRPRVSPHLWFGLLARIV